jgi:hypothetical protein
MERARRLLSRTTPGSSAPWSSSPPSELRITRVFSCVARGLKACASFMFAGCCWWRSLAVDGSSGASRGHAPVVRRPGVRRSGAVVRPSAFQAGRIPSGHESCKRDTPSPVAAVAVTVAVSPGCCLSRPVACTVSAPRTFPLWPWALRVAPLPHRTDCCGPIRRSEGVKDRFP